MVDIRIRKNIVPIYFLYIVIVLYIFWVFGSLHNFIAKLFGVNDEVRLTLDSIASIVGIVAAALAIIISNRHQADKEQQASRDQIYQQLELESNNLFRFEVKNVRLVRIVRENELITYDNMVKDRDLTLQVISYMYQVLNLLEMAVRFRKNNMVHDDVFAGWEAWIFELCKSTIFVHCWYLEDMRDNYIVMFQKMIDDGLLLCQGKAEVERINCLRDDYEANRFQEFKRLIKRHLVV